MQPSPDEVSWDRGVEHLQHSEWDEAQAIGRRLVDLGDWRGHELIAGALRGSGDPEGAAACMERAVEAHPNERRLWVSAGNYRSDQGDYAASHEAFERALACADDDIDDGFVWINMAILLHREHRFVEAHQALDRIDDQGDELTRLRVIEVRCRCWSSEGRYDRILEEGRATLESVGSDSDSAAVAWLFLRVAQALLDGAEDADEARDTAIMGLQISDAPQSPLLELVRRIDDLRSEDGRLFRILVEGDLPEPGENGEALSYFAEYEVAAESPFQALELIREVEHEALRESLRIEEIETLDEHWVGLLGVYSVSDRCSFSANAPDDDA